MHVLSNLEPGRVFHYFEEISRIPRGSYHEKAISDYLVAFANQHGFSVYQDALYNVIMKIPASPGYEDGEPVILQGHMDMVCEKEPDCSLDMERDGLELFVDGDFVRARKTTLGGDDGIAIAYMLAIAADDSVCHPRLEYIITVSEEVGMEGAAAVDLSMLEGHRMLNLDSEEEGVFLTSCAGGVSALVTIPIVWETTQRKEWYKIQISGLLGGHSGCEIDKGRGNANQLLGRVLCDMRSVVPFGIAQLKGGGKDNAIPLSAFAVVGIAPQDKDRLAQYIATYEKKLRKEYAQTDAGILLSLVPETGGVRLVPDTGSAEAILSYLTKTKNGVCKWSKSVPGLVETSLNLGIMELKAEHFFLQHSLRSSVQAEKEHLKTDLENLARTWNGTVEWKGEYPAWEYRVESDVRDRLTDLYERMYGSKPAVMGIHAGLECGLLAAKIPNLDCVAMGPDILDIHTTSERLSISSTQRVYAFLLEFLKMRTGEKNENRNGI